MRRTYDQIFGQRWSTVAEHMPGRLAKQCRERYLNTLDPELRRGAWAREVRVYDLLSDLLRGFLSANLKKVKYRKCCKPRKLPKGCLDNYSCRCTNDY